MPVWMSLFAAVNNDPFAACCTLLQCWRSMQRKINPPKAEGREKCRLSTSLSSHRLKVWVSESTWTEQSTRPLGGNNVRIMKQQTYWHLTEMYILFGRPWRVWTINQWPPSLRVTYKLSGVTDEYFLVSYPWTHKLDNVVRQFLSYLDRIWSTYILRIRFWIQGTLSLLVESLAIETYSHSRVKEPVKWLTYLMCHIMRESNDSHPA
jgi:hypothetical protein